MSHHVIIDDQSPNVSYAGDWERMGAPSEYDGTTSVPINDQASLEVQFYGQKIIVRGTRNERSGGVQMSFAIDSGAPDTITFEAIKPGYVIYDDQLWSSDVLGNSDVAHVLTGVAVNADAGANRTGTLEIFIDSFWVYQNEDYSQIYTPTSSAVSSTSSTTAASTSTTTEPLPPSASSASVQQSVDSSRRMGAIIGGTFGGAVGLLLLVALLLWYQRRRRGQEQVVEPYRHAESAMPPLYGITHNPKLHYEASTGSLRSQSMGTPIQRKERLVQFDRTTVVASGKE
ncbi:hypothetical protein HDZ31DRAFT_81432 [Schizophyllum fasciatum]